MFVSLLCTACTLEPAVEARPGFLETPALLLEPALPGEVAPFDATSDDPAQLGLAPVRIAVTEDGGAVIGAPVSIAPTGTAAPAGLLPLALGVYELVLLGTAVVGGTVWTIAMRRDRARDSGSWSAMLEGAVPLDPSTSPLLDALEDFADEAPADRPCRQQLSRYDTGVDAARSPVAGVCLDDYGLVSAPFILLLRSRLEWPRVQVRVENVSYLPVDAIPLMGSGRTTVPPGGSASILVELDQTAGDGHRAGDLYFDCRGFSDAILVREPRPGRSWQ